MDVVTAAPLRMVLSILFLVLCGLAFLAGMLLNGYVLFIIGCRMERTVSAMLFLNQAMADFFFIIFLPLRFTPIIIHSEWANELSSTVFSLHLFSSAFLLTAISVHRCFLVTRPAWAQNLCTPQLALWVVLGMWALSLGFSFRYSDLWESLILLDTIRDNFWLYNERLKAAFAIQFMVGFLFPLAFIFYILLAAKLRRNRLSQSNKPLKILLGLIPNFFICLLPYHIVCFLLISAPYPPFLLRIFAFLLAYFNSCLNPILYLTMDDEFLRYRQRARNPQTPKFSGPEPPE